MTGPPVQSHPRIRIRRLSALVIATGAVAAGYLFWFWREQSRPGMRHYLKGMEYLTAHYPLQAEKEWLQGVKEDPAHGDRFCAAGVGRNAG